MRISRGRARVVPKLPESAAEEAPRLTELSDDQTVAHRIRNRLTVIVGTSKGLAQRVAPDASAAGDAVRQASDPLDPAEVRAHLERIEAAAWAIDELLDHWVSGAEDRAGRTGRTIAP